MSNTARLVYAILEFLENEIQTEAVSQEAAESLDVAKQCLEMAYGVSLDNTHLSSGRPLMDIFCEGTNLSQTSSGTTIGLTLETSPEEDLATGTSPAAAAAAAEPPVKISEEDKLRAENIKNEGNEHMKHSRFTEAAEAYSKAIAIDNSNPVYFSNRAAAYNKLNNFQGAVDDCQRALSLDPNYSKAYGRLGLAYTGLKELGKAKDAYKKACELDPSNDSYQTNLQIAQQKLRDADLNGDSGQGGGGSGGIDLGNLGPSLGGLDFSSLMSNPALMNMATNLLQNPNMQQMMQSMMGQAMGQGASGPSSAGGTDSSAAMSQLLQMGQQFASQIQQENPNLVEQVRQMAQQNNPDRDNNNQPPQPPPPGDNSS